MARVLDYFICDTKTSVKITSYRVVINERLQIICRLYSCYPAIIAIAINATIAMKLSPIPILNPFNVDI
jgi:hypothetical protein